LAELSSMQVTRSWKHQHASRLALPRAVAARAPHSRPDRRIAPVLHRTPHARIFVGENEWVSAEDMDWRRRSSSNRPRSGRSAP